MPPAVARKLGINLRSRKEGELFKWFLACLLFGKPIQQEIAERAYAQLVSAGLRSPEAVLCAGWDELVRLLDEAHYVRYDFSTATKLLEVCQELKQRSGTMTNLIAQASSARELAACRSSSTLARSRHGFSRERSGRSGMAHILPRASGRGRHAIMPWENRAAAEPQL